MRYRLTVDFENCMDRYGLDEADRRRIRKALALFEADERYPSLRSGKLEGHPGCWYLRASLTLRLAYSREAEEAVFWWVGRHDDFDRRFKGGG